MVLSQELKEDIEDDLFEVLEEIKNIKKRRICNSRVIIPDYTSPEVDTENLDFMNLPWNHQEGLMSYLHNLEMLLGYALNHEKIPFKYKEFLGDINAPQGIIELLE